MKIQLTETFTLDLKKAKVTELKNGAVRVEKAKAQHCNVKNKNGRRYPTEWTYGKHLSENADFRKRIKANEVFGHMEHPSDGRASLREAALIVEDGWMDGDEVFINFRTTTNTLGKELAALTRDGLNYGLSSRATGSVKKAEDGVDEVQEDFEPETWDAVADPSTPGARLVRERIEEAYRKMSLEKKNNEETEKEKAGSLTEEEETQGESLQEETYALNVAKVPLEKARAYAEGIIPTGKATKGMTLDDVLPEFDRNYILLQRSMQEALATPRIAMPVIEPQDMDEFDKKLKAGRIDIFMPFAKGKLPTVGVPAWPMQKEEGEEFVVLGVKDGDPKDDIVKGKWGTTPVKDLRPTQDQIWLENIMQSIARFGPAGPGSPILKKTVIVSREGYILDGHHRFGQAMLSDPNLKLSTLTIPIDIHTLLDIGRAYGAAIGNKPKESLDESYIYTSYIPIAIEPWEVGKSEFDSMKDLFYRLGMDLVQTPIPFDDEGWLLVHKNDLAAAKQQLKRWGFTMKTESFTDEMKKKISERISSQDSLLDEALSKKFYVEFASILRTAIERKWSVEDVARRFATDIFVDDNPRFDTDRFLAACGIFESKEKISEAGLSKKVYIAIAEIVKEAVAQDKSVPQLARDIANYFAGDNPRFDYARFLDAIGISESTVPTDSPGELVELTIPQKHQKKVALDTIRMASPMLGVMGGMDKYEAVDFLRGIGWSDSDIEREFRKAGYSPDEYAQYMESREGSRKPLEENWRRLYGEMKRFLRKEYYGMMDETEFEFDSEAAIYWFASDYYAGMGDDLYAILSNSDYRPGPSHRGVEDEGEMAEMMYNDLESEFKRYTESLEEARLRPGMRVRVSHGSGIASGKEGTVINPREIKTDGRGVPQIPGHYKPVDWASEVAIRYDDGEVDTMYKNRLTVIESLEEKERDQLMALPPDLGYLEDDYPIDVWEHGILWDLNIGTVTMTFEEKEFAEAIEFAVQKRSPYAKVKLKYLPSSKQYRLTIDAGKRWQESNGGEAMKKRLGEKWGTQTKVDPGEKGKWTDYTVDELRKRYNNLKKRGPHSKGSKELETMRELAFAIRAKTGWGEVGESYTTRKKNTQESEVTNATPLKALFSDWTWVRSSKQLRELLRSAISILKSQGDVARAAEWQKRLSNMPQKMSKEAINCVLFSASAELGFLESVDGESRELQEVERIQTFSRPEVERILKKRGIEWDNPVEGQGGVIYYDGDKQVAAWYKNYGLLELYESKKPDGKKLEESWEGRPPKPSELADAFQISEEDAKKIISLGMRGSDGERTMDKINDLAGGFGVEVIRSPDVWDSYSGDIVASYVNTGDTYSATILYDEQEGTYQLTTWGDWVEEKEREGMTFEGVEKKKKRSLSAKKNQAILDEATEKMISHMKDRIKELQQVIEEKDEQIRVLEELNEAMDDLKRREAITERMDKLLSEYPQLAKAQHMLNQAESVEHLDRLADECLALMLEERKQRDTKKTEEEPETAAPTHVPAAADSGARSFTERSDSLSRLAEHHRRKTKS